MDFNLFPCRPSTIPSSTMEIHGGMYFSYRRINSLRSFSFGISLTHFSQNGAYPRFLGSTYTIPQRDTVAGDAYCKSETYTNSTYIEKCVAGTYICRLCIAYVHMYVRTYRHMYCIFICALMIYSLDVACLLIVNFCTTYVNHNTLFTSI